jgi:hypothetical protein
MNGRRVYPDENGWFHDRLEPGEYVKVDPKCMADGSPLSEGLKAVYPYWMGCAPNGHACALGAHTVVEHEDGTITVSPSILIATHPVGYPERKELYHGFLERGVWRDA